VPVIGLTGGVATGKSTFAGLLRRELPMMELFDSDRCVHDLLAADDATRDAIAATFGPKALDAAGRPDRAALREIVFADESRRRALEAILHPVVRAKWQALARRSREAGGWLLVDIPLLYETGAQGEFDRVIVVASQPETQLRRMIHERGLAPGVASKIISAQLEIGAKTQLADHVIWNDSTVPNLDGQTRLLAAWLRRRFA
jgi:dephospho-CoA kinase